MKKILIPVFIFFSQAAAAFDLPATPTPGPSESIGKYDNGCISGAQTLPNLESDYEIMRPQRNRYYGHANLVMLLETLSAEYDKQYHRKLLIGDMGQPRGALMLSGHASHQIGLDVDIWYKTIASAEKLSLNQRQEEGAEFLVDDNGALNTELMQQSHIPELLKLASDSANVERIFVNPKIKMALCQNYKGQSWLSKIRPWWQHRDHFHIRLFCPKDSPDCVSQAPLPKSDGCDASLAWWGSEEAAEKAKQMAAEKTPPRVFHIEKLPPRCQALFKPNQ